MQTMNPNKQIVLDFFEALNSGDIDNVRPFMCEETIWRPMVRDMTDAPEYQGAAIIDKFLKPMRGLFKPGDPKVDLTALVVDGDNAAAETAGSGHTLDGRPYANKYAWFFELKDGKIMRVHEYLDSFYVARLFNMGGGR